jgi:tripartite-type tricarboxylate transporter receptor subunit TctC
MHRRTALALLAVAPVAPSVRAQEKFPSRPITLVVAYTPGGGTDAVARIFAARLSQVLGGQVIVDNKPGAGGNLATEIVGRARPDGYTLLVGNQGPMVVNPHLFASMPADPETALDPVALIADTTLVVVVGPRLAGVKTLPALIAEGKKRPGELTYASSSNASASHLAAALLCEVTGFRARHVPYRGAAPALNDVVGGHVDFMITTVPSATGLIDGGKLTALAVTGTERAALLPSVPTAIEAGVAGYTASAWYGLLAPKGLPPDILARLEAATAESLGDPQVQARLKADGAAPIAMGSAAFGTFMKRERARWGEVVRKARITVD